MNKPPRISKWTEVAPFQRGKVLRDFQFSEGAVRPGGAISKAVDSGGLEGEEGFGTFVEFKFKERPFCDQ